MNPIIQTPWEAEIEQGRHSKAVTVIDANDVMICECYEGEDDEREAYARLIAAAPDLLEAAKACVLWYANRDPKSDQPYQLENQPPEIQRAMTAIAKAEGRAA